MDCNALRPGLRVRVTELHSTQGMSIASDIPREPKSGRDRRGQQLFSWPRRRCVAGNTR